MASILFVLLFGYPTPAHVQQAASSTAPAYSVDYELGPGDVLSIHVSGLREFDHTTRVSNSGRIHVPYVGIMLVAGQTAVQVERDIARLIKEHELINEPTVRIDVEQHRANPVYLIGEFTTPGQYIVTSETYLLDLIGKAGGLLSSADDIGFLYRRKNFRPVIQATLITPEDQPGEHPVPPPPPPTAAGLDAGEDSGMGDVTRINLTDLVEGARPELNVKLQGGDILYVPRRRAESIFIIGDVHVPGGYTLPRHGQITAAQAIIYAGGPMPTAKMGSGFLMRHDAAGVRQAMPVDFSAILEGKSPDIPVRAGDIIFVPNSAVKTIGLGLLTMLPALAQQMIIF